ncbi:MAG: hypothetical protein OEP48_11200 [Betaproteobacteria bacterium]|nr:hypothetical protein [Betaproteobacteria bacterium]MDH3436730.1 hypothetical protein [Betaproteobacteria bacterium]
MEGNNRARVVMLAGAFRIKGEIELVPGARITDYMIESKPFIAVTNAEVWDLEGRRIMVVPFVNINRDHVVVVAPDA